MRAELFAGARLGFRKGADRSLTVGKAAEAEDEEKEGGSRGNGACVLGYSDLNDWDGDSCTSQARDAEQQTGRRAADRGPRVLSIAVVLKILRGDSVVSSSALGQSSRSAAV